MGDGAATEMAALTGFPLRFDVLVAMFGSATGNGRKGKGTKIKPFLCPSFPCHGCPPLFRRQKRRDGTIQRVGDGAEQFRLAFLNHAVRAHHVDARIEEILFDLRCGLRQAI